MQDAIVVHELGKQFRRYDANRPRRLKELFIRGPHKLKPVEQFWALREIEFHLEPGRMIGVIGRNGSGKSTLLRLIGDVLKPDEGWVKTQGRIGALLNLGSHFHSDLTGRENVYVSGVIAGLTRREVAERFDSIVAFAELEEFIDGPLRTYSTGMRMRLAFAVAVHIEPDILLIDEVLAVGDLAFRQKCFERIQQFKEEGCTILLVTHDIGQVKDLCDEAIWLHQGKLMAHDDPNTVVTEYEMAMRAETRRRTPKAQAESSNNGKLVANKNRFGSQEVNIRNVRLLDGQGAPVTELNSGEPLCVEIEYDAPIAIEAPIFSITIDHEEYKICCTTNTVASGLTLPTLQGSGQIRTYFERLDLNGGRYFINVGIYEQNWNYSYDFHWRAYPLTIQAGGSEKGVLHPPHRWELAGATVLRSSD
jgi:lipopolysaccharide transport system ATP-binding protein